jgi:hypothetical protein
MIESEKEGEGEGLIFNRLGFTLVSFCFLFFFFFKWQYKEVCGWIYLFIYFVFCFRCVWFGGQKMYVAAHTPSWAHENNLL